MKKLCVFVFSVVMIFNLPANEHNFSVGASFGLLNGQAQEIVYREITSDNKLSELLWNFNPLAYLGLDIEYSWLKPGNGWGLFANGLTKFGFSGKTGVLEDRDWDALYLYKINNPYWLTNYSVHDNKTETAILMDFNLGVLFLISQKFLLKPYLSYHYMYFSFTASGGSILYSNPDKLGNPAIYSEYLPAINIKAVGAYEQTWHIFSPAISFYGEFNRFFDIEIAFEVTPFIWCVAIDKHLLRHLVFTDILRGGLFIEPSFLFSYKPSENFTVSLSCAYREISKSRGDTKYKKEQKTIIEKNLSGAGYTAFDIGIIAKYIYSSPQRDRSILLR